MNSTVYKRNIVFFLINKQLKQFFDNFPKKMFEDTLMVKKIPKSY